MKSSTAFLATNGTGIARGFGHGHATILDIDVD